jgi:hypothetical protein
MEKTGNAMRRMRSCAFRGNYGPTQAGVYGVGIVPSASLE